MRIDGVVGRMRKEMTSAWEQCLARVRFCISSSAYALPERRVDQALQRLDFLTHRLWTAMSTPLQQCESRLMITKEKLSALEPSRLLQRGYTFITDAATGRPIRTVQDVRMGLTGKVHFYDGNATVVFTGEME